MNNNNRFKGMYALLVAVAAMIGITIYGSCSADEDFWGFDEEYASTENTRAEKMDMSEYLTLSMYEPAKWDIDDHKKVKKAINRIDVQFVNNQYTFGALRGKDINVSDSLYNYIISMFEHTNMIFSLDKKQQIVRNKRNDPEISPLPNCVPAAIHNMGYKAPSYNRAVKACNKYYPHWVDSGGVPLGYVEPIIEEFTPVTVRTNMYFCPLDTVTLLRNLVLCFGSHAANAYKYDAVGTPRIIYYHDFSATSTGNGYGFIYPPQMNAIFTFDELAGF